MKLMAAKGIEQLNDAQLAKIVETATQVHADPSLFTILLSIGTEGFNQEEYPELEKEIETLAEKLKGQGPFHSPMSLIFGLIHDFPRCEERFTVFQETWAKFRDEFMAARLRPLIDVC